MVLRPWHHPPGQPGHVHGTGHDRQEPDDAGHRPGRDHPGPDHAHARQFNLRVLVEINNGATVNISNLTIAGPAPGLNAGILIVQRATANIAGTTVTQIQNPATFGVQTGFAIQIGGSGAQAVGEVGHATITNCIISAYQKVGIIVGRNGSTGTITDTTITGVGPTRRSPRTASRSARGPRRAL